jgi:archaemetzincin
MNLSRIIIYFAIFLLTSFSCQQITQANNSVIVIQPFNDFTPELTNSVFAKLKEINPNTILRTPIQLPKKAYYPPRNRYRADSLIKYLSNFVSADTVVIGLTNKDISTTKGDISDFGVMGLGYCPGNSCVVSTFRLAKTNISEQFFKLAIHELGHTQGLPHCSNKICFMRDANGKNVFNEEKDFCPSCKSFLKNKGWKLK